MGVQMLHTIAAERGVVKWTKGNARRYGGDASRAFPVSLCVLKDNVRRLFADHVHRAGNEESRNTRKYRCIHHTQPLRPMHAERAVQNAVLGTGPNRATARCVMTPCMGPHKVPQLLIGLKFLARQYFFSDDSLLPELGCQFTHEADAVYD